MYKLVIESENGNTLDFSYGSPFQISEIQGLHPPGANINTSEMALIDGERFNSAKLTMRTLDIAFSIEYEAAKNRIEVYSVLQTKGKVRVYYESKYRNVHIDGYVKSMSIDYFGMKQIVTVSILCPSPCFLAAQEIVNEVSSIIKAFHFEFASTSEKELVFGYIDPTVSVEVANNGDLPTGLIFELYALQAVSKPKIFDYITGDFFGLNFDMKTADLITINTIPGQKTVKLLRNGVETNVFNSIMKGSKWLQLPVGVGYYTYEVGSGQMRNLIVEIRHYDMFEGV